MMNRCMAFEGWNQGKRADLANQGDNFGRKRTFEAIPKNKKEP